ncbi:MAG TPA: hypothetical protein DHW63_02410, partial [Hyphomonadaceae bacterium]|nr:hypothetical protein [Hyphomonadaceae bacterium]
MVFLGYGTGVGSGGSFTEQQLVEAEYRAIVATLQADSSFANSREMQALAEINSRGDTAFSLRAAPTPGVGGIGAPFRQDGNDHQIETVVTAGGNLTTTRQRIEFLTDILHEFMHQNFVHSQGVYDEAQSLLWNINHLPTTADVLRLDMAYGGSYEAMLAIANRLGPQLNLTPAQVTNALNDVVRDGYTDGDTFLSLIKTFHNQSSYRDWHRNRVAEHIQLVLAGSEAADLATLNGLVSEGFIELIPPPAGQSADDAYRSDRLHYLARPKLEQWRVALLDSTFGFGVADGRQQDLLDWLRQEGIEATGAIRDAVAAGFRLDTSDLLSSIGQVLGRELAGDNPLAQIVVSSTLQSVLTNLGEWMETNGFPSDGPVAGGGLGNALEQALGGDLLATLEGQAVGAVSSYLIGQLADELGLEGVSGQLATSVGGRVLSQIATNLLHLGDPFTTTVTLNGAPTTVYANSSGQVINSSGHPISEFGGAPVPTEGTPTPPPNGSRTWNSGINAALFINVIGSYIGGRLAMDLLEPETRGGQIGAAVGQAYGSINAAAFLAQNPQLLANPVLAVIAVAVIVFIDTILGGLIGSLFGGTPKAGASLAWNENEQEFRVANVWSKNQGPKDAVRSFATQVGELLNGVVAASGSRLVDVAGVQAGAYEVKGKKYWYKPNASGAVTFSTKDAGQLVNHGAFIALYDLSERLVGGDVYIKRAVTATMAMSGGNRFAAGYAAGDFEANTLFGNIATAQDYAQYLQDGAVINALIAAEPSSAFTAGWTITFARVLELGLDRRWKSDWLGGWAAFLDETADGKIDGTAFAPGNVFLELDPETSERLFVFVDSDGALLGVLGDTVDTASKDRIVATAGADTLTVNGATIALTTALTLNGAAAVAGNRTIRVAALIDGAAGNDTIRGGDLGNDLIGGDGNDVLVGGKLDDWLIAGAGDDRLFAANAANIAFTLGDAAAENAALALDGGNGDYLEGGAGADALYGSRGSD